MHGRDKFRNDYLQNFKTNLFFVFFLRYAGFSFDDVENILYRGEQPLVDTSSVEEALRNFCSYLEKYSPCILCGHNVYRYDVPILMRYLQRYGLCDRLREAVVGFSDTLQILRRERAELQRYSMDHLNRLFASDVGQFGKGNLKTMPRNVDDNFAREIKAYLTKSYMLDIDTTIGTSKRHDAVLDCLRLIYVLDRCEILYDHGIFRRYFQPFYDANQLK